MKLKKIASLMLAGIMAVSMLAGCKTGTTTDDEKNPTTPATPSVVTYANDALNAAQKEVFTFKANAELDTILKDVATSADNFDSDKIEAIFSSFTVNSSIGGAKTASTTMKGKVSDKLSGQRVDTFSALKTLPADEASQKVVQVLSISGGIEEELAVKKMVKEYAKYITDEYMPRNVDEHACTYSADISVVKVASPEHTDNTAWVMAVVVTQNVTKTANA